ncbi:hypothetical protein EJD97_006641 [Solanum chilense]|uniref:Uncharacterized protein n=1 Tax=Solanum chilense TaxID=4083 RepID=A0A6N2AIP1_SOLCI|nr:hypothetical protein EJD97_006641 [Solanum chilense]
MSDPSSASKQMHTTLSEIEPITLYSPSSTGSRSNLPSSSPSDNPENTFHSIDLNSSSVPTGPGNEQSIHWKVERRDLNASKKGKEKVVGEVSKKRPITRSDAKKMMVDSLKANLNVSAEKTEKGYRKKRSGKRKPRETKKVEQKISTKETAKGKRKRSQEPGTQVHINEEQCKFEPQNLPGLMLEHMYNTVIERNGIRGIGYRYFLTEVFKYFNILLSVGKGKEIPRAKWLNLLKIRTNSSEVEELTMRLSGKDAEIANLNAELLTAQIEGPGSDAVQAPERENTELRAKVIAL